MVPTPLVSSREVSPHPGASPVIRFAGFRKRYGGREAVAGVDLVVWPGEIYGLIGPDAAGKSSLLKAAAGVLSYEAGEVEVFGRPVRSEREAERIKGRLGFMPQGLGLNLYPELSVEENIDFFARLRLVPAAERDPRKERLLAMTRLDRFRDRPMKNLSGGMKQKLGLICSLIHGPELLLLDEPTTGVDPVSRRDFWTILGELLQEGGTTALVATAYMDEASRFHRLSLMHAGRVLAEGDPDELLNLAPGSVVQASVEAEAEALDRFRRLAPDAEMRAGSVRVFLPHRSPGEALAAARDVLRGLPVHSVETTPADLEDVFIALLHSEAPAPAPAPRRPGSPGLQAELLPPDHADIEARELTRDFGSFRAVDRVSFQVRHGEIFGLLGANGAGKTTVIKMLTGILKPTAGTGHVAGADMLRAGHEIKRRIGYVSQSFSLYQDLTVLENLNLYAGIYGLDRGATLERVEWALALGGLEGHQRHLAGSLPMGLRQRLALGCALMHRPQVLFLDEPTSGVDPLGRRQFWQILHRLARQDGVAVLVTTHYMSEAERCDRLALMYAGRLVADAAPEEMKRQVEAEAGRLLEVETAHPAEAQARLRASGYPEAALFGNEVHLFSRQPEEDCRRIPALLAEWGLGEASAASRALSMEDVFVYRVTALERRERQGGAR